MKKSLLLKQLIASMLLFFIAAFTAVNVNAQVHDGANTYATIQAAINAASSGDIITVDAGAYAENVTVNKSLTIMGVQSGNDARTRSGAESSINGGGANFTITADNVTVDGFTLTGPVSSAAIVMQSGNIGETIKNNIINNPGTAASITTSNTSFLKNKVVNTFATATDGFQWNSTPVHNLTISDNSFSGADPNNYNADITVIEGNSNVVVSGNSSNGDGTLVALFKTNGAQITGNTVVGAGFSAIYIGGANSNVTVSGNQVSSASSAVKVANSFGDGVNSSVTITGNTLQTNTYGVYVTLGSVTDASTVVAHQNSLTGNTLFGINNEAVGTLSGTCNWWGSITGPTNISNPGGTGAAVSDNVSFTPWLNNGTDGSPAIVGFQPTGSCTGTSSALCSRSFDFSTPVVIGPTQAPNVWYTDRYPPKVFTSPVSFDGGNRLREGIDATDGFNNRPAAYQSTFYNTQGRVFDLGNATTYMEIMLYVPSEWATSGKRMAGFWGTLVDANNTIAGWPSIEFVSDGLKGQFTGYDNGKTLSLGLPSGFHYNTWVKLSITLQQSGQVLYTVGNIQKTSSAYATYHPVRIANVILEGFNTTAGVTYDIYWDDFAYHCYAPCSGGDVLMCYNGTTYCVKQTQVSKKTSQGYVLGECTTTSAAIVRTDVSGAPNVAIANPNYKPVAFGLSNFPNPFVGTSTIKYDLPFDSRVSIKVYDVMGRVVASLVDADKKAGSYTVDFKAGNLSSGSLYYRIIANSKDKQFEQTNKMTQLK